ncbi:MAG TPA: C4-type zinc ribbon domain-containing protein [Candidatus Omnitrophota bacterium]|nr:C4-type zinc ribbon domain-containing protein [Candidatus Omnitrophota bacterium]HQL41075.1 C4-type zinc ribbon domain-containing protein [Candidatus Omnitrophota bacterium]
MAEVLIQDQTRRLVELQKIDGEFYEYKIALREKPEKIEELKKAFEQKKTGLKDLEDRLKAKQLERKEREGDLQVKEADIAKANGQLSQLKTNKEYKAKLTEIEGHKADKSIIEEKILILFDEIDAINNKMAKEKESFGKEEKKFSDEKAAIESEIKQLEDKVKVLESQRQQKAKEIDGKLLSQYERILKGKEGLAMVPVKNNSCGGCYMNVPAQVVNEIQKHEGLVSCEFCARILYLEDSL